MDYFDSTIYTELFDTKFRFPTLLYLPMEFLINLDSYLEDILNEEQLAFIFHILGPSGIYYYDSVVQY